MGPFLKWPEVQRATSRVRNPACDVPGTTDYGLSAGRRRLFRHARGLRGDAGVREAIARSSSRAPGCKDRGPPRARGAPVCVHRCERFAFLLTDPLPQPALRRWGSFMQRSAA